MARRSSFSFSFQHESLNFSVPQFVRKRSFPLDQPAVQIDIFVQPYFRVLQMLAHHLL